MRTVRVRSSRVLDTRSRISAERGGTGAPPVPRGNHEHNPDRQYRRLAVLSLPLAEDTNEKDPIQKAGTWQERNRSEDRSTQMLVDREQIEVEHSSPLSPRHFRSTTYAVEVR
jgi:hypothetical protein